MATAKRKAASNKTRRGKPKATRTPSARARVIAAKMPLVHYPASTLFEDWRCWPGLQSRSARALAAAEPGPFARLRNDHVFAYAGPLGTSFVSHFHRR